MSDLQAPPAPSTEESLASNGGPPPLRPPITVYKARRPRRRRPLWVRLLLWSVLALVIIAGAAGGGVLYFKVYQPLQNVTSLGGKGDVADLKSAQTEIDGPPPAGAPATALVIGYDHRVADGAHSPSRSDTLMLIHVDPKRKTLTLLSIPRDTRAYIPGHGVGKINEAYSLGKAKLAIDTVKNLLPGLAINYVIAVNFHGFVQTVNAFGGVYLDIDRRYLNINDGTLATDYANIDLQPGYQLLRGDDALSYVRFRHNDSDVIRTVRQQQFVREFKTRLDGRTKNPGTIIDLINILSGNVKIAGSKGHQPGFKTMYRYLRLMSEIPRKNMLQVHLNGPWDGTYINVAPSDLQAALQQFKAPDLSAATTVSNRDVGGTAIGGSKGKKSKSLPVIPEKKLKVWTLNGSAIDGQANEAAIALRAAGYPLATVGDLPGNADLGVSGNAWKQNFFATKVYYANLRAKGAAQKLRGELGDADANPFPPQLRAVAGKADVVVVTGHTYDGVHAVVVNPTVPTREPARVVPVPSTMLATWKTVAKGVRYPILAPSVMPAGTVFAEPIETSYPDPRVYTLNGHKAAHLTAWAGYTDPLHVWGIQWMRWPTAPILLDPSSVRLVKGKSGKHRWQLYYNGGQIHRIAIFYGKNDRYVTWVDNSLGDGFNNQTMIAVAKGLRPVAP